MIRSFILIFKPRMLSVSTAVLVPLLISGYAYAADKGAKNGKQMAARKPPIDITSQIVYPEEPPKSPEDQPTVNTEVWHRHMQNMPQVTSKAACLRKDGSWYYNAFDREWTCSLPTPDAGKICHDDTECAMYCKPDKNSAWGRKSQGSCETHYDIMGCLNGMTNGFPSSGPCID